MLSAYQSRKHAFVGELFRSLFVAALLCFIAGVIWAAISSYDPRNSASGFVVTIFVIIGLAAVGMILYATLPAYRRITNS